MTAPAIIQSLVLRFRDSRELYRSGHYNEAQLRLEFLNPFFEALGWDMYNRSNFAPQYREVIHEDSLEIEGSSKAPDYAFRIGTTRKFFVEAKKPKVNIRYEIDPAYQLRRYAWNAHLPLSILTDFEELAIYDCRNRPDPKDSAATGRVKLFNYQEYLTRWDELAEILSRDAVWSGSFDRFAEGTKGKQGTTEVDAEFLKEIEEWRLLLARNIALRNFRSYVLASDAKQSRESTTENYPPPSSPSLRPKEGLEGVVYPLSNVGETPAPMRVHGLPASEAKPDTSVNGSASFTHSSEGDEGGGSSTLAKEGLAKQSLNLRRAERQLNYAVQTTIDRILFLRICEDRAIEPADQLLQIAEGTNIYSQLLLLFQKADLKYNSGLFHFNKEKSQTSEPDAFTPTLAIDDKVLRQIIKSTYYPCPYIFNEIPVEILGQVYEQFLGKVIRLTAGGQAKVEEKPEVRKAGGVYYTPRYIVDYIVKNTLGKLLNPGLTTPSLEGELKEVRDSISLDSDVGETIRSNSVLGLPTDASGTNINGLTTPSLEGELKGVRDSISLDSDVGDCSTARCRSQHHDHGLPASAARLSLNPVSNTNQDPPPSSPSLRPKEGLEGVVNAHIAIEDSGTNTPGVGEQTPSGDCLRPAAGRSGDEGGGLFDQLQQDPSLTPAQALNLRVVDPACGSGSFLLGAYQYLLDWHLNYYLTHDPQAHTRGKNPPLVAAEGGEYRLTTQTKKQILTSCIYGVDIDSQAVEVTKLSLLLKLLEGETGQLTLGFERVLPDLGNNVRCGNSLIGWDYFQNALFPDEEEIQRVNPFDWQHAFPQVFASGGFDAVIGNPPYIGIGSFTTLQISTYVLLFERSSSGKNGCVQL